MSDSKRKGKEEAQMLGHACGRPRRTPRNSFEGPKLHLPKNAVVNRALQEGYMQYCGNFFKKTKRCSRSNIFFGHTCTFIY